MAPPTRPDSPAPSRYGRQAIAEELVRTVLGEAYYGNALYVSKDIPGLSDEDRHCLQRWLVRKPTGADCAALLRIADKIAAGDDGVERTAAVGSNP